LPTLLEHAATLLEQFATLFQIHVLRVVSHGYHPD